MHINICLYNNKNSFYHIKTFDIMKAKRFLLLLKALTHYNSIRIDFISLLSSCMYLISFSGGYYLPV